MEDDVIITIENEDEIVLSADNDEVNVNFNDRLTIVQPTNHNELLGLDYESSGHIGFAPSRLSTLPDLNKQHDRMNVLVMVDDNGTPSKVSMSDMFGMFLRTGSTVPEDMQAGEYLFLEKQ